ncbi:MULTISPECIES: MFS transporter [unclassified Bradyrhizobium]
MNSSSISAGVVAPHPARLSLIYAAVFTILWTWLIYALPALPESGVPAVGVRLISYGLLALGLWLGLERTSLTPKQRQASWLSIMIPFTLWATAAWTAAIDGAFRAGASSLPLLPAAMLLPVIVGAPVLLMSKRIGQLLDAMPATWLIALQLYRIFGSQWLAYWLGGSLPGLWALPAGTGDVLTGLFAIPAAIAVASGTAEGRRAAILWNVLGLADFAVAITLGMIMSPGPFQLIMPQGPSMAVDSFPNVLTPAFVVPSSILLHALSLRQLFRRRTAETV